MPTKTKKKKPLLEWSVDLELESFDFIVKARTKAEAKKKALAKAIRKGSKLVNHKQTYVDKV